MKKPRPSHRPPHVLLALLAAQAPSRTLADLRPNALIDCMYCNHPKPQAGAVKFHAHHVCAECAAKVLAKQEKSK